MKIISRYLMIALLLSAMGIHAQRKPRIKGNREVTQVTESLPSFSRLELKDDLEIVLKRSAEESFSITADDNLIDIIKFKVNEGTLVISSFYEITAKKELSIVVNYNQLNTINVSDGRVLTGEGEKINADRLTVVTTGESRVILDAAVGQLNIDMQDSSRGEYTMTADSLSVTMQGRSDAQLYVNSFSGSISVRDNASLLLEGTSGAMDLQIKGDGKLRAEDFEVDRLTADLSGTSDSQIFARSQLQISLSGTSRCYLFGEPEITMTSFKDSAEFFKRSK